MDAKDRRFLLLLLLAVLIYGLGWACYVAGKRELHPLVFSSLLAAATFVVGKVGYLASKKPASGEPTGAGRE